MLGLENRLIHIRGIIVTLVGTAENELVLMLVQMIVVVIVLVLIYLALITPVTIVTKVVLFEWKVLAT